MILVYCEHITSRHHYVFRQIFNQFLQTGFRLVSSSSEFNNAAAFVINYSKNTALKADLHIVPQGMLDLQNPWQHGIQKIPFEVNHETVKFFKYHALNENDPGFDVFSAVFWMLSRCEEYASFRKFPTDSHGRFTVKSSDHLPAFIKTPVVDAWCHDLKNRVNKKFPGLISDSHFTVINTIDVDNAYAYKGKSSTRQTGAFARHLLKGQFAKIKERGKVLRGHHNDPYDTYAYIRETATKAGVQTFFFHLVGKLAERDRNISPDHPAYTTLLKELNAWSVQGLHPSYASNTWPGSITSEKKSLEKVLGIKVNNSRQHFLKLEFPATYRNLIAAGIQTDFSLGFADEVGFRAGTGKAFYFYDLEAEKETNLLLQPLCAMDSTLRDYMKLSPEQAIETILLLQNQLKTYGSTYVAVWHNETLGETNGWEGWRTVYESQFSLVNTVEKDVSYKNENGPQ
ncbi:MAG TPA: polysaccharide deacetylase family protein [Flavobacteriales bacterium]|nr:polysaccharide deacetylase family protein [Flavobacteriales bacterium]